MPTWTTLWRARVYSPFHRCRSSLRAHAETTRARSEVFGGGPDCPPGPLISCSSLIHSQRTCRVFVIYPVTTVQRYVAMWYKKIRFSVIARRPSKLYSGSMLIPVQQLDWSYVRLVLFWTGRRNNCRFHIMYELLWNYN